METLDKTLKHKAVKFDFTEVDFDVLRERERQEAIRRREEIEQLRREQEAAAAVPPPITYSEEEYEQARKEAFEAGTKNGQELATQSQNQQILDVLKGMVLHVEQMINNEREREELFEKEALQFAFLVAKKAVPALVEKNGNAEIEAFIGKIFSKRKDFEKIKISVPESLVSQITEKINVMFSDKAYIEHVDIIGVVDMPLSACIVEWDKDYGVERNTEHAMKKIDEIIQGYLKGMDVESSKAEEAKEEVINSEMAKESQKEMSQNSDENTEDILNDESEETTSQEIKDE